MLREDGGRKGGGSLDGLGILFVGDSERRESSLLTSLGRSAALVVDVDMDVDMDVDVELEVEACCVP